MARLGVVFCPTLKPVQHQHHSQLSGNLDLILARLCRESLLVQVVKVGMQQRLPRGDTLRRVVDQHLEDKWHSFSFDLIKASVMLLQLRIRLAET